MNVTVIWAQTSTFFLSCAPPCVFQTKQSSGFLTILICRNTPTTQRCLSASHYKFCMKRYQKRPHTFLAQKSIRCITESQNGQGWKEPQWVPGWTKVINCTGLCEAMLTAPDHNSHLLSPSPVWHLKEQQLPEETQHMQQDETCFFLFPAPFVPCSQPINIPASCLHLWPALAPQAAPWPCIPISVLFHPQASIFHLAPSSLQKPESQPTLFTYWCPKPVCLACSLPCNTHFSSRDNQLLSP